MTHCWVVTSTQESSPVAACLVHIRCIHTVLLRLRQPSVKPRSCPMHVNVELSRISETDMVSDLSVSSALPVNLLLTHHHLKLEDLSDIQASDVTAWTLSE
ncbi:hypothetical protein KC361_g246 [Hortaea werneckii]|nr:hypothetical protein KC361_g246 [Hortaea werneckii]